MDFDVFKRELLNSENGVRKILRKRVSKIDALESLLQLRDLEMIDFITSDSQIVVAYNAIATSDLYPNPGEKLIDLGVFSKDDFLSSNLRHSGLSNENDWLQFGLYQNKLQIILEIYNPDHSFD
ncbi:hypothetical protein GOV12_02640 [Candidatus Pacearchaeota archaeon]|nr:hypothetical protein [Candidatus Pacearchaeota archaeon]